jgi:tetratricopeptide (TPR) repeat protein
MRLQICAMSALTLLFLLGPKVVSSRAYARADAIAGQGPLQEMIAYLEQAIRFDPPQRFSLPIMARLGRKYRDAELSDEAPAFASRTFDLMRRGKYRAALAEIEVGRRRHPNDRSLRFFESVALEEAGRAAFDQGQTTEALRYWRASQSTARLSPFSLYGESLAELRNDDTEAAARALAAVLALQQSLGFKRLTVGGQAHLLEAWRLLRQRKAPGEIHAAFALAYQPDQW